VSGDSCIFTIIQLPDFFDILVFGDRCIFTIYKFKDNIIDSTRQLVIYSDVEYLEFVNKGHCGQYNSMLERLVSMKYTLTDSQINDFIRETKIQLKNKIINFEV